MTFAIVDSTRREEFANYAADLSGFRLHVAIVAGHEMTAATHEAAASSNAAIDVLLERHSFKVGRIHTDSISTEMIDGESFWYQPLEPEIRLTVSPCRVPHERAIAAISLAGSPVPALRISVNGHLREEGSNNAGGHRD